MQYSMSTHGGLPVGIRREDRKDRVLEPRVMAHTFAGRTFVLRIDRSPIDERHDARERSRILARTRRPADSSWRRRSDAARSYVRALNRNTNVAVGLSGADAAHVLPASRHATRSAACKTRHPRDAHGRGLHPRHRTHGIRVCGHGAADIDVARRRRRRRPSPPRPMPPGRSSSTRAAASWIPRRTRSSRNSRPRKPSSSPTATTSTTTLRKAVRAAAHGVRAGVGAAQILDGRIAHAAIVEFLTDRHLGTQVTGTVYLGAA